MNHFGKLHALLSTARVANIPSVVSNVWVGMALATGLPTASATIQFPWNSFLQLSFAGVALYVSGNFFNDWMDRDWDAVNRPERALPSGRFNPRLYLVVAVQLAVVGFAVAASVSLPAVLLAGMIFFCVAVYTWIHKKSVWSVIPMGLCRALLPVMGAAGVMAAAPSVSRADVFNNQSVPAIALFCYIVGLTTVARSESLPGSPVRRSKGLLLVPVALGLFGLVQPAGDPWWALIGIVPYLLWIAFCDVARNKKVCRFVSFLLAGIPLVDWIFLLPLGILIIFQNGGADPFGLACLLIPPLAFVSALFLQRLAPAT